MLLSIATLTVHAATTGGSGRFIWLAYLIVVGLVLGPSLAIYRRLAVQRLRGFEGRNWPTISATIHEFTVDEDEIPTRGRTITIFEVTLQYVFHNPEIQIGEYLRKFGDRDEAEAWANSFKGCTVKVHVDPKDPTKSILRKEELEAAVSAPS